MQKVVKHLQMLVKMSFCTKGNSIVCSRTRLMPVDIGQETLDQYFKDILNTARAECNNSVKLRSHTNEAKCKQ